MRLTTTACSQQLSRYHARQQVYIPDSPLVRHPFKQEPSGAHTWWSPLCATCAEEDWSPHLWRHRCQAQRHPRPLLEQVQGSVKEQEDCCPCLWWRFVWRSCSLPHYPCIPGGGAQSREEGSEVPGLSLTCTRMPALSDLFLTKHSIIFLVLHFYCFVVDCSFCVFYARYFFHFVFTFLCSPLRLLPKFSALSCT